MATALSPGGHRAAPSDPVAVTGTGPWWLWLSLPIGVLGLLGSVAGIVLDRPYRDETDNWAAQAVGQDIANLVVLSVLLVAGYAALRGSLRGLLVWLGTVGYTAYTYAIYAFDVHFGPFFLLYVAVLGASVWALVGVLADLEPRHVRVAFTRAPGAGFASVLLVVVAVAFAFLWLAQDVPAMLDGTAPKELRDTGLPTNPVHVLDLGLLLPATAVAGVLLRRRRAWGYVLAPVVLVTMASLSAGIVAVVLVSLARDLAGSLVVAAVIGMIGALQAVLAGRLLSGLDPNASTADVLRR